MPGGVPGGVPVGVPGRVFAGLIDGARLAGLRLADFLLIVRIGFRALVAFGFDLGLLIPGIVWPSCCAKTLWSIENESEKDTIRVAEKKKCLDHKTSFFMMPILI